VATNGHTYNSSKLLKSSADGIVLCIMYCDVSGLLMDQFRNDVALWVKQITRTLRRHIYGTRKRKQNQLSRKNVKQKKLGDITNIGTIEIALSTIIKSSTKGLMCIFSLRSGDIHINPCPPKRQSYMQKVKWKMMVQLSPSIICNNQGSARYLIFWHETPTVVVTFIENDCNLTQGCRRFPYLVLFLVFDFISH
jgi:hypothetical protein